MNKVEKYRPPRRKKKNKSEWDKRLAATKRVPWSIDHCPYAAGEITEPWDVQANSTQFCPMG
jgi:hypothetical protein